MYVNNFVIIFLKIMFECILKSYFLHLKYVKALMYILHSFGHLESLSILLNE